MEQTINVQGMTCGHCKMSVENALTELDGVQKAEVNLDAGNVAVTYDETKIDDAAMKEAIEDQGYDVE
ncbi:copper chaperone CopZ [Allobacillus sp. GCM10007491]|uniref:Copper chaperone CopZ n=1 Tax=Allobacillus saliphilus TaxID=2912308 RepID=A0A941CU25_9BACI|nr:copper chaperone CopZ [Allobacillus saliphilus]MBR7553131.1 copper chaperone CopZ [Allobacillus saliphilus]